MVITKERLAQLIDEELDNAGVGLTGGDVEKISRLLDAAQGARQNSAYMDRMTTFSKWYKGEHKQARATLVRSLRALASELKNCGPTCAALMGATVAYIDAINAKSGGSESREFSEAARAWRAETVVTTMGEAADTWNQHKINPDRETEFPDQDDDDVVEDLVNDVCDTFFRQLRKNFPNARKVPGQIDGMLNRLGPFIRKLVEELP